MNPEENVYFHFSKPLFIKNKKYALVSMFKNKRCEGDGFNALYRNDHGIWKKIIEFNRIRSKSITSHIRCEDIMTIDYE